MPPINSREERAAWLLTPTRQAGRRPRRPKLPSASWLRRPRQPSRHERCWADLVSMYGPLLRIHVDEFGSPLSDDLERYFRELNGRATVRREALRAGYQRGHSADSSREF